MCHDVTNDDGMATFFRYIYKCIYDAAPYYEQDNWDQKG